MAFQHPRKLLAVWCNQNKSLLELILINPIEQKTTISGNSMIIA